MKIYATILKDGEYNNYCYKKGEIYEIKEISGNFFILNIKKHNRDVLVSYVYNEPYGLEAELVTEDKNKIIELWD